MKKLWYRPAAILDRLRERFSELFEPAAESICYATTNRQEAVSGPRAEPIIS